MREGFVRILTRSKENTFTPVGAGVLVSRQWILTCAHVVNTSLNLPPNSSENPDGEIWLDFPLIAPGKILRSRLVVWQPPQSDMQGDIAGLELTDDLPRDVTPLRLIETHELWEVPFRAFGFPVAFDQGIYARGALIDYISSGWLQVEGNFESSTRIQPGFSGGPIWVESLGGVVGIIVMAEKYAQSKLAFAIPTQILINIWPELRNLTQQVIVDDHLRKKFLIESAELRENAHTKRDIEWQDKGYQKSAMPSLDPKQKVQIFSNRSKELGIGIKHLKDHRMFLITGLPGIGKSTLARALLELMPIESPPAFWYDFEHHQSSGNTLGIILDRISGYLESILGIETRDTLMSYRQSPLDKASAHEVDILTEFLNQEIPMWLVFDNLEVVLSRGEDHFRDEGLDLLFNGLKKNTHTAKIIITSSVVPNLSDGEIMLEFGTRPLVLQGLDDLSAVSFLRASGLQDFPEEALISLSHRVVGHPFALVHVAHFVQELGIKATLENLQGSLADIAERFESFLQQRLSPADFVALQALTVLQRAISLKGLCKTAQCGQNTIRRLRSEGLLEKNENEEFRVYAIVRSLLATSNSDAIHQAHIGAMQYYRELDIPTEWNGIDQYANVFEWHYHAIQAGDLSSAYAALFNTNMADRLKQWNEFSLLARMCEDILAKEQPEQPTLSKWEQAKIYHTLGIVHYLLDDYAKSVRFLETALGLVSAEANKELRARIMIDLAESYGGMKEIELALDRCQQALTMLSEKQEDWLYAKGLQVRGIIYRLQGTMNSAMNDLERARELFEKLNDPTGSAYVTGELGIAYFYQNQFDNALENYRRTIVSCEQNHDMRGAMIGYFNVGDILLQEEEYEPGSHQLRLALELARKMKFPQVEASAGLNLVEAQIALHQLDEAERGLEMLKSVVDKQASSCLSGQALRLQASLCWASGQVGKAVENFKLAFDLMQNDNCQYERARSNLAYADFLSEQGEKAQARITLVAARDGFTAINSELGLRAVRQALQKLEENR